MIFIIIKKIFKKNFFFKNKCYLIKKKNFLIKKEFNIKKKNIFYKNNNFVNNKKNFNYKKLIYLFFYKLRKFFLMKININYNKEKYIKNDFYKFSKKSINYLIQLKKKNLTFIKNIKISLIKKKRFSYFNNENFESINIKFSNYYFLLNILLIKKKTNFVILKKYRTCNKIINYSNILLNKLI
ncbi:hypothetical protein [Candidatus Carsonella ruddii]|uniref:Uncharacterized protein n=1 Tax=Carsonella ruddii TaxID=114186 RepID=A0AAE7G4B5_CARRU|nr:hypothetical protein [Candidatus Carsonella ruddii]AGS06695.1 hypothetical protein CRDC_01060 [Candidatus Carsonella ruddii DC]ALA96921.1 hypothetical protein AMC76_01110 [Candidatus Carsonella ruddii]QLK14168.1 hypothetical protein FK493_01120 [Candidatus Carsonella ruddii]